MMDEKINNKEFILGGGGGVLGVEGDIFFF